VETHDSNVILLDDETSIRQRVIGAVVMLLIVAAIAFPFVSYADGDTRQEVTPVSYGRQAVADICGPWNVPDLLQPVANAAYPSWNWVCQLIET
jgi:hypothetical protein